MKSYTHKMLSHWRGSCRGHSGGNFSDWSMCDYDFKELKDHRDGVEERREMFKSVSEKGMDPIC